MRCDFLELTGKTLRSYHKPCVYELYKEEELLYIGHSSQGLARVFGKDKGPGNRGKAFEEADRVTLSFFDLVSESSLTERNLIHRNHPKYNMQCFVCASIKKSYPSAMPEIFG